MKRHARVSAGPAAAGLPLLDFLSRRFTYHDRGSWLSQIAAGRLLINDVPGAAGHILQLGDRIEYRFQERPEPPVNLEIASVYEDPDLLVIAKPAHLPCHPAGRFFAHTLWALLRQRQDLAAMAIINRLDRETSGLVLVTKTAAAEKSCRAQFAHRHVEKRYLVLVEGRFPETRRAVGWLTRDRACEVRKRRLFSEAAPADSLRARQAENPTADPTGEASPGEWADTRFKRIRATAELSLVEARPMTGRQHQIRATLAALGFPVVGDKLYGVDPLLFLRFCTDQLTPEDRRRLRLDRQALHAAGLSFHHPVTRQPLAFELPLPADLAALLDSDRPADPEMERL